MMVELFFFTQRGIFERTFPRRQCASMRAMNQTMRMQNLQIFANRNLRGFELTGEFGNENPSLMTQQIENGATTFFVEHGNSLRRYSSDRRRSPRRISFYSVSFRLSTENGTTTRPFFVFGKDTIQANSTHLTATSRCSVTP